MDILPTCAQLRQSGTVITLKDSYGSRKCNGFVIKEKCEMCGRTKINGRYSDCDSVTVKKCRPHRSSIIRSKFVNVCAAVCLLLLVGDLTPQSSAAPRHRRANMENPAWANPCDLANGPSKSSSKKFTPDDARTVANQAKAALDEAQKFKDLFAANLQSYDAFNELSDMGPWLQNLPFVTELAFPKEKNKIDMEIPADSLSKVTDNIEDHLPVLYKTLKMVAAGLYAIKENGLNQDLNKEMRLKHHFDVTFNRVRQVLCVFNELMLSLDQKILPLMDDEIPNLQSDRVDIMFMIYRDSMLYLDYLRQVMNHWANIG